MLAAVEASGGAKRAAPFAASPFAAEMALAAELLAPTVPPPMAALSSSWSEVRAATNRMQASVSDVERAAAPSAAPSAGAASASLDSAALSASAVVPSGLGAGSAPAADVAETKKGSKDEGKDEAGDGEGDEDSDDEGAPVKVKVTAAATEKQVASAAAAKVVEDESESESDEAAPVVALAADAPAAAVPAPQPDTELASALASAPAGSSAALRITLKIGQAGGTTLKSRVQLFSSANGWSSGADMKLVLESDFKLDFFAGGGVRLPTVFEGELPVAPGARPAPGEKILYKFRVDESAWACDDSRETVMDESGNRNNVFVVPEVSAR